MKNPKPKNFFGHSKKEFTKMYLNFTATELSKKLNVPASTISSHAKRAGITKPKLKTKGLVWTRTQENYLLENYEWKSVEDIMKKFGRSKWSVINKFRELKGLRKKN